MRAALAEYVPLWLHISNDNQWLVGPHVCFKAGHILADRPRAYIRLWSPMPVDLPVLGHFLKMNSVE